LTRISTSEYRKAEVEALTVRPTQTKEKVMSKKYLIVGGVAGGA